MDRWDWILAAGVALIAAGLGWWAHPAAALIILGVGACAWSLSFSPLGRPRAGAGGGGE